MNKDAPVKEFPGGRIPGGSQLNEVVRQVNALAAIVSSLQQEREQRQLKLPLAAKITEVTDDTAWYKADTYLPPYNVDSVSSNFLGSRVEKTWLFNLGELNGGAPLSVDDVVDASMAGTSSDGLPVVKTSVAGGFDEGTTSSPVTLGSSAAAGASADTASYDRESVDKPLELWVVTDEPWDSTNGKLLQRKRKLTFPRHLAPKLVSAEFESLVNQADTCSGDGGSP